MDAKKQVYGERTRSIVLLVGAHALLNEELWKAGVDVAEVRDANTARHLIEVGLRADIVVARKRDATVLDAGLPLIEVGDDEISADDVRRIVDEARAIAVTKPRA